MADALGFPDATNTGVQAGVTLKPYNGNLVISTPGAVISGLDIHGSVLITAPNVTLINCKITSTDYSVVQIKDGVTGTLVQNCEITGTGSGAGGSTALGGGIGTQIIANNIWGVENGLTITGSNNLVQDNYIHDLATSNGGAGHYDGIQAFGGGFSNTIIRHNTIIGRDTSDIFVSDLWGANNGVVIDNNQLLGTSAEPLRLYGNHGYGTTVSVTNNVIQKGGYYYVDIVGVTPSAWSNNVDYATGKILSKDNTLSGLASPQIGITAFSTDSGTVGDHITSDNTLTLTGTATANTSVKVFDGANQIGTATANSNGAWTYTTAVLAEGSHSLAAKDSAGTSSTTLSVTIDTLAPSTPAIVSNTISANKVTLNGTAEANSKVQIFDGSTQLGTATTNSSGAWTYATNTLNAGIHNFTANAMDAAGNVGGASASTNVTIGTPDTTAPVTIGTPDTTTPVAPTIASAGFPDATNTGVQAGVTLKPYNGNLVISTPGAVISGLDIHGSVLITAPNVTLINCKITSTDYSVVQIKDGVTGTLVQNCEITGTGSGAGGSTALGGGIGTQIIANNIWGVENGLTITGSNNLVQDNYIHDLATSNGGAGHYDGIQAFGGGFSNTIIRHNTIIGRDTSDIFVSDLWGANNGVVIDNNQLLGTSAEPLRLYGNHGYGTTVSVTNNVIQKGGYYYVDIVGVTPSAWSNNVDYATGKILSKDNTLSGLASPQIGITAFSTDSGTVGDHITNDNTLTLTGTAAANSSVKVFDGANNQIGTATANSSGAWTYTTAALTEGSHSLIAKDNAGNSSTPLSVTVDTLAPSAPTIGSNAVSSNKVTLNGTAEANSKVQIFDGTTQLGTATTNSSGAWTYVTNTLNNGVHNLTAKATDAAGNLGGASASTNVTIGAPDTTPPAVPTVSSFSTDTGKKSDGITNDNTLTLTGSAEASSTVKVFDNGKLLGSAVANASGTWAYTTVALTDSAHVFTSTATDAAGNISAVSTSLTITVDTKKPNAPVISGDTVLSTNQVSLTGTAEADSAVSVFDSGTLLGTASADGAGAWTYTSKALAAGPHAFTASASDVAGNASSVSAIYDPIVGGTTIEANGTIELIRVANKYYLDAGSGAVPSTLKFGGADYVDGQFGAWAPIGAEKTATGYEIAWKNASTGQYTAWNTDNNGNYASNVDGLKGYVSGTNIALQSLETALHQDLNGDGQVGLVTVTIESQGSTDLTQAGDHFFLYNSTGSGPTLKFGGADYVDGQFGAWAPIGAEKTATGYEIAWKNASTGQYTAWNTDNNGNYVSNVDGLKGYVSGTNAALQSLETTLHQDLNGDGQVGFVTVTIESQGSTDLTQAGDHFFLYNSTGSGPTLKFGGADYVDGQFGAWAPIGAEKTATGYEIAWKNASTGQYTAWNTDNNGNYVSNVDGLKGYVSATNTAFQSLETALGQDLNKDGYVGLVLNGSAGAQALAASGNPTTLVGGPNDVLTGGAGADTFVFPANFGANTVKNFTPGVDTLQFSQTMFADFAAVLGDAQQVGSNVVITHDPQNVVTLENVKLSSLHGSDIHIV